MYTRTLTKPNYSFFLFGPRGTGKTTWLRAHFPNALWKNLLLDSDYLPLLGDTTELHREVEAQPKETWIVIDEVQRIPSLLNQVHNLISLYGSHYRFALSGSSARKLRRLDVNLLAGRAIERGFFPLTSYELGQDYVVAKALSRGTLPSVWTSDDNATDILSAYVGTYLSQEIQQEALLNDIGSFNRFLKVAAIMNGQIINISATARDTAVARSTVERYFDILVDTLIGFRLPAWLPRLKVRERVSPKFYFFDTGVVRALSRTLHGPLQEHERGPLLETLILHELRAALCYLNVGGDLAFWRSPAGREIDFVWERGEERVAIEVKASTTWRRDYEKALHDLSELKPGTRLYGVYLGEQKIKNGNLSILPVEEFLRQLHGGMIF